MNVGANIKQLRKQCNMTQEDLAVAVNVSRSMIAQIERGSRCPSVVLGYQIADALHVELDTLIKS